MMVLMTCPAKKTGKQTVTFDFSDYENIELDSLESYADDEESVTSSERKLKRLDLNGISDTEREQKCLEEFFLDHQVKSLSDVEVLSLRSNNIQIFPPSVLRITSLLTLDLSYNQLVTLPHEICQLINLQELFLDHNCIVALPESLILKLQKLQILRLAHNKLCVTPEKFLSKENMRAFVLTDGDKTIENAAKTIPLGNLNLRSNRLKGNIILGNYGNLTELDVSDNAIESLDLSAVDKLQVLQCSRNVLVHLSVHGKHLTSLIAGNNKLAKLSVVLAPTNLRHIDVSFNDLIQLPDWLSCCHELRSLFASHNKLTNLPDHLFCNEMPYLHTLQLAYNQIQNLPNLPRRIPVQELFLQNNSLSILPENFFKVMFNVRVLNLTNNRLCELPVPEENCMLEKLYLTANCLTDKTMNRIGAYVVRLRVFHGAYNSFTSIPEDCSNCWPEIEEIVLSGNKLLRLPDSMCLLKHLRVLRVHSNLLQTSPKLYQVSSLRVLDLAHNQLDRIDLSTLVPSNLKFLDLSCNIKLHVDSKQFQSYKTHRPMSLVDVSGRNRTSLPLSPLPFCENDSNNETNWTVGFSETSGVKQRLYISQIRLPAFCNTEALFGIFDGESNNIIPFTVEKVVPRILMEERTVKETAIDYMKYTMLSSHRELKDKSQKSGLSAIIIHILRSKVTSDFNSYCSGSRKYILRAVSVGDIKAVIGRSNGSPRIIPHSSKKQLRNGSQFPLLVPDPDTLEIYLEEQDEFLVIANKNLWDVMSPESVIAEVKSQSNVILAAKRLQDLAQSYGAEDNISVIVIHFSIVKSDVDQLMKELRQTIRKNKYSSTGSVTTNTTICQAGCCCETNNSCSHCLEKSPQISNNDDRSSPSGQSDHACSDCNSSARLFIHQLNNAKQNELNRLGKSYETSEIKVSPERRSYRGVAKAVRAKIKEEDTRSRDDTDSALSEEQFKCWEYMLEQNTQLLFDKELNTLSRGIRRPVNTSLIKSQAPLSRSSPHLADPNPLPVAPLLTRHFGSTRSFNPLLTRASQRFSPERRQLVGGPHAAYFGSLQRLMPYNLEYDFAVMQERGITDSIEMDRMNQYWGVTTTEL